MVDVTPFRGSRLTETVLQGQAAKNRTRALDQRDRGLELQDKAITERNRLAQDKEFQLQAAAYTEALAGAKDAAQFRQVMAPYMQRLHPEVASAVNQVTDENFTQLKGSLPSGMQEFEALTEGMSEEDILKARRIELGLDPRAVGNATMTITNQGNAADVGETSRTLKASEEAGKVQIEMADNALKQIPNVRNSISNINEAIDAIDQGASTGAMARFLPSLRESSILLDNVASRMGLDIISMGKFGPLSEGEMRLAMTTAIPPNLSPPELRQWLLNRRRAQETLLQELGNMASFLSNPRNSLEDYVNMMTAQGEFAVRNPQEPTQEPAQEQPTQEQPPTRIRFDSQGNIIQ